ncbi:MAG: alpha/beta hydrolase-fold protein [Acidobacteria bacterium]|nr:alpha/beta hydrolase-fold protein [Acidobacteriota bacterium]
MGALLRFARRLAPAALLAVTVAVEAPRDAAAQDGARAGPRFEVRHPSGLHDGPLTGRLFLAFSPTPEPEPRIAAYNSARQRDGRVPFFAVDVTGVAPGEAMLVDREAVGYPYARLGELPPGDYWVQALVHVYTEYRRRDGHVIRAPQDQWEGQRWAFSPGNLVSEPRRVRVDPASRAPIRLTLGDVLPPVEIPPDTEWVRRVKIRSRILSEWWGHPMHLGAVVLLPRGYDDRPDLRYPMVIEADHFTLEPAFGFTTEPPSDEPGLFDWLWDAAGGMRESGYDFQRAWTGDDFPRVIAVRLQHPTPFFDDSYGLNSANNGPYGDAIHQELIPYLERTFRMIGEPYARVLTGGSTGGWMSLAWQVHYPTFYGGTWTFYPDSVDFRRYQLVDIYADANAFLVPNAVPGAPERMFQRTTEGQPVGSVRQLSRLERAQGSRGRSAGQLDAWNAAWGPVGTDGYPRRLWDLETGAIDREVAFYMRDNGYDLRHHLAENWSRVGPDLVGKIRIYNPEMDQFYLSYAVYLLEELLEGTSDPHYGGEVVHGRPLKGHGWSPFTNAELVRRMADHVAGNAPAGAPNAWFAAP